MVTTSSEPINARGAGEGIPAIRHTAPMINASTKPNAIFINEPPSIPGLVSCRPVIFRCHREIERYAYHLCADRIDETTPFVVRQGEHLEIGCPSRFASPARYQRCPQLGCPLGRRFTRSASGRSKPKPCTNFVRRNGRGGCARRRRRGKAAGRPKTYCQRHPSQTYFGE